MEKGNLAVKYPISVAPMMDYTDRHFRYLLRLLSRRVFLYTEMIPIEAVVRGERDKYLQFSPFEKPLALQLGGREPKLMAEGARIAKDYGYDEININVGCPSSRVQSGSFGVVLMREPELVAEIVSEVKAKTGLPVGVKFRLGIDSFSREFLERFVEALRSAGCDRYTVHARIAILDKNFDPKDNRTIPPLLYGEVYRLKELYPELLIELNGGIKTAEEVEEHLRRVDGVMIGRAIAERPAFLAELEEYLKALPSDEASHSGALSIKSEQFRKILDRVVAEYAVYLSSVEDKFPPTVLLRPLLNLFKGLPGAKHWRRELLNPDNLKKYPPSLLVETLYQKWKTRRLFRSERE